MTDEERQRLLDTRFDIDLYPKSAPRHRSMRVANRSRKQLRGSRTSSTERNAIRRVYSTQSEGW